jgi:hypothetical protein
MTLAIQMIRVHYKGSTLSLLDSDDTTQLYFAKVSSKEMKMSIFRTSRDYLGEKVHEDFKESDPSATASFSAFNTEVLLNIHGRPVKLWREKKLTRTYNFSDINGNAMFWKADGALTGDFKLVDEKGGVIARFHNKVFSTTEVGTFEIIGPRQEQESVEIIISGLAVLAMVQSSLLALMLVTGGS